MLGSFSSIWHWCLVLVLQKCCALIILDVWVCMDLNCIHFMLILALCISLKHKIYANVSGIGKLAVRDCFGHIYFFRCCWVYCYRWCWLYTLFLSHTHTFANFFPFLLRFFSPLSCILSLSVWFYFRFNAIFLCLLCTKFACVCCWILWFYFGSPFIYISFHTAKPIYFFCSSCVWSAAALLLYWYPTHLRQKSSCVYCKCWHTSQQDKDSKKIVPVQQPTSTSQRTK